MKSFGPTFSSLAPNEHLLSSEVLFFSFIELLLSFSFDFYCFLSYNFINDIIKLFEDLHYTQDYFYFQLEFHDYCWQLFGTFIKPFNAKFHVFITFISFA